MRVGTLRGLRTYYSELPVERQRRERLTPGQRFGKWHLVHKLGSGANAEVWKVRSVDGDGAIKLLRRAKGASLLRFRAEVKLLQDLADEAGILPILDHHLPDKPSTDWDVWLIAPVAIPVVDHIQAARCSPWRIVAGIHEISQTMAVLHSRCIYHRDLKPENLLTWRNRWVVCDFGIASFPGKEALTTGTHKLGPVHFIAPEMLHDPKHANGGPADVYSLAKTLWVLLSDQRYPLSGEQRADNEYVRIEQWVEGWGIDVLNDVFERCTQLRVEHRMTMSELRDTLGRWLSEYSPR